MKLFKRERGFTLLEVLIVVAIIIIIAGIAVPRFLGVSNEGKKARAAGDLKVLQTATESFALNKNKVPDSDSTVGSDLEGASPQIVNNFAAFEDPFSTATPKGKYKYFVDTGKKFYVFLSVGPDGTPGSVAIATDGTVTGVGADDVFVTNGKKT